MSINQILAVLALIVFAAGAAVAAYGLRYVPINGDGINIPVLVWDRWTQEVCQIYFTHERRYCAQIRP